MGSAAFCIGSTAFQCLCSLCSSCGATKKVFSRIGYVMFAFIWILASIVFLFYGHYIFELPFSSFLGCEGDENAKQACIGVSAVYRTSFTLTIFHVILFLLCLCGGELISKLNEGAWPAKFVFVLIIFVLTFFMSNGFFKIYGYCAMVASFFFIVYQMILLIGMAYSWNENWVGKIDNSQGCSERCWAVIIITGTVVCYGGGITVYVLLYLYRANSTADYLVISLPVVAAGIYTGLTVSPFVEGGSVFTCSLLFLFGSFLTSSIQFAIYKGTSSSLLTLQIIIGLAFMFFVLFYAGSQTIKADPAPGAQESAPAQQVANKAVEVVAEKEEGAAGEKFTSQDKEDEAPEVTLKTAMFHLLMAFASLYYSMVISNWGAPNINGSQPDDFSSPYLGYAAMLSGQWVGILFFIWSLIAPRICPDREFK